MADLGLLQPIGVTPDHRLVFGERRLKAAKQLGWEVIDVRILDIDSILDGEYAENEIRKDFTPSERVAIAKAIERDLKSDAKERQGARTDLNPGIPDKYPESYGKETRQVAAQKAGFGSEFSYRQAKAVVESGVEEIADPMDSGEISVNTARTLPPS